MIDYHKLLETQFACLESSHRCLLLDKKKLDADNQTLSTNLSCTTLDLRIFKKQCKKAEVEASLVTAERDSLLEQVKSFEVVESMSLQTVASLSSNLEKLYAKVEPLRPRPDLRISTEDFGCGLFQSYLS